MGVPADVVAVGDDLGGLKHGHVGGGQFPGQPLVGFPVPVLVLVLDQGNRFDPTPHGDRHAVDDDLLGRGGDRHQAGRALPVDGHSGHRDRQVRAQRSLARHVEPGGTFGHCAAEDDIVDLGPLKAGPGQGPGNRVRGQVRSGCVVERPAEPVETITASLIGPRPRSGPCRRRGRRSGRSARTQIR